MQINSTTAGGVPNANPLSGARHAESAFEQLLALGEPSAETAFGGAVSSAQSRAKNSPQAKNISASAMNAPTTMAMPVVVPIPASASSSPNIQIINEGQIKGAESNTLGYQQASLASRMMWTSTADSVESTQPSKDYSAETERVGNRGLMSEVEGREIPLQSSSSESLVSATDPGDTNTLSFQQWDAAIKGIAGDATSAASFNRTPLPTENQNASTDAPATQISPDLAFNSVAGLDSGSTLGLASTVEDTAPPSATNETARPFPKNILAAARGRQNLPDAPKIMPNHASKVTGAFFSTVQSALVQKSSSISQNNQTGAPSNTAGNNNGIDNHDAQPQEAPVFALSSNELNSRVALHGIHAQKSADSAQNSTGNPIVNNPAGSPDGSHDMGAGHQNSEKQFAASGAGTAHQKIYDEDARANDLFANALKNQVSINAPNPAPLTGGHVSANSSGPAILNPAQSASGAPADLGDGTTSGPNTSVNNTPNASTATAHGNEVTASNNLALSGSSLQAAHITAGGEQAAMKIGMHTSAFGAVEVHASVHQSQVGLVVGSEQGDLKTFFNAEIPALRASLSQHDLHFANVRFEGLESQPRFSQDGGTRRDPQQQRYTYSFSESGFTAALTNSSDAEPLTASQSGLSIHA